MHRSQTQGERVPESGGQKSTLVFNSKITGRPLFEEIGVAGGAGVTILLMASNNT